MVMRNAFTKRSDIPLEPKAFARMREDQALQGICIVPCCARGEHSGGGNTWSISSNTLSDTTPKARTGSHVPTLEERYIGEVHFLKRDNIVSPGFKNRPTNNMQEVPTVRGGADHHVLTSSDE